MSKTHDYKELEKMYKPSKAKPIDKERLITWIIGGIFLLCVLAGIVATFTIKPDSKGTKTTRPQTIYDDTDYNRPGHGAFTPYEW